VGKEALVAYICMRPEHRDADGAIPDHLTIHEGAWGYCAKDGRLTDHVWEATGGVTLAELQRFQKMREPRRAGAAASAGSGAPAPAHHRRPRS
jgi:hypothetical protein